MPRAREALDKVSSSIETRAGVTANFGKTRVYNRAGGPAPPGIAALGAGLWRGDADETERGLVALGTLSGIRSTSPPTQMLACFLSHGFCMNSLAA